MRVCVCVSVKDERTPLFSDRTYNYEPIVRNLVVPTIPNNTYQLHVRKLRIFATIPIQLPTIENLTKSDPDKITDQLRPYPKAIASVT